MKKMVLAASYVAFREWCQDNDIDPTSVFYVADVYVLRGNTHEGPWDLVVADDRFWGRRDAKDLYEWAQYAARDPQEDRKGPTSR